LKSQFVNSWFGNKGLLERISLLDSTIALISFLAIFFAKEIDPAIKSSTVRNVLETSPSEIKSKETNLMRLPIDIAFCPVICRPDNIISIALEIPTNFSKPLIPPKASKR